MSKYKDLETFLEQSKGLLHKYFSKTGLKYWVRLSLPVLARMAECHVSQPCPLLAVVAWWRTATFKPRSLVLKQQYTANIATLQLAGSQNCVRDTLKHTGADEMIYFYVKNQSEAKSDFDLTIAILRVV